MRRASWGPVAAVLTSPTVAKFNGDTKALAEHWGVKPDTARLRKREVIRVFPRAGGLREE
jgi:hypothetical protein